MPKLKTDEYDIDFDELENAPYEEDAQLTYTGEIPPKSTTLNGYVRKAWWTETKAGQAMIKILYVAAENEGDKKEFDGCPFWENYALTTSSKWKWKPFLDRFGFSLRDVKTKTIIADEDDNVGAPITKIGAWTLGEDSDAAWSLVITDRERYQGEWQARIGTWLYDDEGEEPEDEPEPEDLEEEEVAVEEEQEEEPAPPRRRATSKPAKRAAESAKPTAKARSARAASSASATKTTKPAATTKPASRGRRTAAEVDEEEPPF